MTVRITDFDRGLGYGLLVALTCSVGAYWLGQDRVSCPLVDDTSARSITPMESNKTVDEVIDEIVIERRDAGSCRYTADGWVCITDIVTEAR